jgi:hypothetical protein
MYSTWTEGRVFAGRVTEQGVAPLVGDLMVQ